jgi:multiple sugar transport system substrate-binding protein
LRDPTLAETPEFAIGKGGEMSIRNLCARGVYLGLACVALCAPVILLTGCGETATPTPVAPAAKTSVTFTYWSVDRDVIASLVEEFERQNPDVNISLRHSDINSLHQPGTAGDVAEVWWYFLVTFKERGHLLDLGPFIEADPSFDLYDYSPSALASMTIDGRLWAIPYGVSPWVIYYNKDLFDRHGMPYPEAGWTWDDFLAVALAIRDADAGVYGYASIVPELDIYQLALGHGALVWNGAYPEIDVPLFAEVLKWYGDLYHASDVAYRPEERPYRGSLADPSTQALVTAGRAGVWGFGYDSQAWWRDGLPPRWGMVPFPRSDDSASTISGPLWCRGYAILSYSDAQDASWRWITFLSERFLSTAAAPVRGLLIESDEWARRADSDVVAFAQAGLESSQVIPPEAYAGPEEPVRRVLGEATARVEYGESSPQEAAEWAGAEIEAQGLNAE